MQLSIPKKTKKTKLFLEYISHSCSQRRSSDDCKPIDRAVRCHWI